MVSVLREALSTLRLRRAWPRLKRKGTDFAEDEVSGTPGSRLAERAGSGRAYGRWRVRAEDRMRVFNKKDSGGGEEGGRRGEEEWRVVS